jgi:hypothetical protein
VDGRSGRGSIDDFWVRYNSFTDDPYITGSWAEHPWGTAVGDFLKTSQSSYGNLDGETKFWGYTFSGAKMTCDDMANYGVTDSDGTYGRKLFYEARGYAVTDCFNQYTNNRESGGFSLANYRAQIDAGQPVLLNLEGHSIVGVGYEAGTNKIYIHDTWDKLTHSMVWGGIYAGMKLIAVSVVNLAPTVTAPAVVSPIGATYDTTPTYEWNGIVGATQYRYQVMRGTTAIYTRTIACRYGFPCSSTPTTVLPLGAYKWRVQANIDGVWQPYSDYHSFSVGFRSQFNGNAAGWVKRPGAGWTFTSGGYYGTNGVSNKISSISYSKSFTDFTYQVRMKRSAVDSDGGQAGLVVRGSPTFVPNNDWRTAYEFIYSSLNGNFQVWSRVNAVPALLQDWTPSPSIAANDWNTLKVIAKGESLQFYINDSLVWSGVDSSIHSGQVGIWDGNGGSSAERLDVDWATLDPIDPSTP